MIHDHQQNGGWNTVSKYIFIGFALIAGYFLITEHRAHVVQYLPFVLLAACPLMHLFHGHGGHGRDEGSSGSGDERKTNRPSNTEQHHHH